MKTPEQMAEKYANDWYKDSDYPPEILIHTKRATANVFLAGYKAAQDQLLAQFKLLLSSFAETSFNPSHTAWQMFDILNDQVADVSKVMNSSNNSNGWISVKERLPEINVDVLIYVNFTVHNITHKYCSVALFDGACWDDDGWYSRNSVTHWMPLPKPPEDK